MKKKIIFITAGLMVVLATAAWAQGVSRSSGLGIRASFWNITDQKTRWSVSTAELGSTVDVSGVGSYIYYFSKIHSNFFFETHLGGFATVHSESGILDQNMEVSTVVPLLFGLRWDLLPSQLPTNFQPYLTVGGGPYWRSQMKIYNDIIQDTGVAGEVGTVLGWYAGGGMNIMLSSWFALNFDIKHHFLNYDQEDDFSGLETSMGIVFMWGEKQEMLRIEEIRMVVDDLYPAYSQFYSTYPVALVAVKNTAGYDIEVNVRSELKGYSSRPKNSGYYKIERGETRDIPVVVLLNNRMSRVNRRENAVLEIEVEGKAGHKIKKTGNAQITIHSRNAWNGEIEKLNVFLTPEDDEIRDLTRRIAQDINERQQDEPMNFAMARSIFEVLHGQDLRYHPDPNIPFYMDDRVQYANETLRRRSGDCDDLVILYASLLESVGIRTAFVEVKDPEKSIAHVYLMFDTGVPASEGFRVAQNEKRYVIRVQDGGESTVWVPVETTLIGEGFEDAWRSGALAYLQEGKMRSGLADGWMRIIDHH